MVDKIAQIRKGLDEPDLGKHLMAIRADEQTRQVKKRSTELLTTVRRLEEKIRQLQQHDPLSVCLSLFLSLKHTHTHTHTVSISLSVCVCLSLSG